MPPLFPLRRPPHRCATIMCGAHHTPCGASGASGASGPSGARDSRLTAGRLPMVPVTAAAARALGTSRECDPDCYAVIRSRDRTADQIVSPGAGQGSRVRVFDGRTLAALQDFTTGELPADCRREGRRDFLLGGGPGATRGSVIPGPPFRGDASHRGGFPEGTVTSPSASSPSGRSERGGAKLTAVHPGTRLIEPPSAHK